VIGSQTDQSPAKRLEKAERRSGNATLAILGGIFLDIVVLLLFPDEKSIWEIALGIVANAAIGIGLVVEYDSIRKTIVASGELQRDSDAKLKAAMDRASKAQEDLIKYLTLDACSSARTKRHL
jgi:hypothetical protein